MPIRLVGVTPGIFMNIGDNVTAFQTGSMVVGPSDTNELLVTVEMPGWAPIDLVNIIQQITLQARQSADDPTDNGWPDQFAIQYIGCGTNGNFTTPIDFEFKILRLDPLYDNPPSKRQGWGQDLQVDFFAIVTSIPNPNPSPN